MEKIVMKEMIYFPLNREGVMDSLKVWDGDVEPIGKLTKVWVQVKEFLLNGVTRW